MDPDANLKEQRGLVAKYREHGFLRMTEASRLAELFAALDEWIKRGGFLPAAWKPQPLAPTKAEQPKNLRVLSRLALRELANDDRCAQMVKECVDLMRELTKPGEPWPPMVVDTVFNTLRWCSEKQGDVPLWNRGGQGYRALNYIRNWKPQPPPISAPDTAESLLNVAMNLLVDVEDNADMNGALSEMWPHTSDEPSPIEDLVNRYNKLKGT